MGIFFIHTTPFDSACMFSTFCSISTLPPFCLNFFSDFIFLFMAHTGCIFTIPTIISMFQLANICIVFILMPFRSSHIYFYLEEHFLSKYDNNVCFLLFNSFLTFSHSSLHYPTPTYYSLTRSCNYII